MNSWIHQSYNQFSSQIQITLKTSLIEKNIKNKQKHLLEKHIVKFFQMLGLKIGTINI